MGNGVGKLTVCFTGAPVRGAHAKRHVVYISHEPLDDTLGHSFCYRPADPPPLSEESAAAFRLSGASVSANTSTPPSTADPFALTYDRSSAFEGSTSFAAIPLQPIPRGSVYSGPLVPGSGPMERGFLSGPIERGFMSGPLDNSVAGGDDRFFLPRSFSHGFKPSGPGRRARSMIRDLRRAISKKILPRRLSNSVVAPLRHAVGEPDWALKVSENRLTVTSGGSLGADGRSLGLETGQSLQWAQGRAGEDRVHVVVSEEHGWVFVGIYDGFNGPDAPDYLTSNLYDAVHEELKGLLWDDNKREDRSKVSVSPVFTSPVLETECSSCTEMSEDYPCPSGSYSGLDWRGNSKRMYRGGRAGRKRWENQRRWKCEWDRERIELDKRIKQQLSGNGGFGEYGCDKDHREVLDALALALRRTEEAYLDAADKMVEDNPELALMGSCVLVMLMKGEDVYVMNVGDSRAVLAHKAEPDYGVGKIGQDLERINEETDEEWSISVPKLNAFQLTADHSTSVEEEVRRIKREHPDDASAVLNDRVKGSLKVTRAFGAGFLKQPKWNNALLEMFRIDYVGDSPYLTCSPSLRHHRLGPNDRFLILSSDGLYQYLTNEEAVDEVELFIALQPEGDPAQHLVEEVLFRAAKKAGMDFHELLDIPQGDRRRYHDDISVIVISLEGKIWRSCL